MLTAVVDQVINCPSCAHYFITHEASFPYGCRAMGFKSKQLPSLAVVAATAEPCQSFQAKATRARRRG